MLISRGGGCQCKRNKKFEGVNFNKGNKSFSEKAHYLWKHQNSPLANSVLYISIFWAFPCADLTRSAATIQTRQHFPYKEKMMTLIHFLVWWIFMAHNVWNPMLILSSFSDLNSLRTIRKSLRGKKNSLTVSSV